MQPSRAVKVGLTLLAGLCTVAAILLYLDRSYLLAERRSDLTVFELEQLEFFRDRAAALLTTATLLLGAGGALFVRASPDSNFQQNLALLGLCASGLSMVFGCLSYDAGAWMMRSSFFDLAARQISIPARVQQWALVVSLGAIVCAFALEKGARH
jgi:hypothetical protein